MTKDLKEKAIEMRKKGISIIKIGKELGVAKSTVSVWTRGVTLTQEQRHALAHRPCSTERAIAHSNTFKIRRLQFQEIGKEKIKKAEPLYIAGCMLYWGEGSKNINRCELVNSELPMLIVFKKFLLTYFDVSIEDLKLSINAYTDCHTEDDIKKYWLTNLELPDTCLKYTLWNQYPSSSKKKARKLEYGTCALAVYRTEVVQEIFGAIQEFGKFENEKWLG